MCVVCVVCGVWCLFLGGLGRWLPNVTWWIKGSDDHSERKDGISVHYVGIVILTELQTPKQPFSSSHPPCHLLTLSLRLLWPNRNQPLYISKPPSDLWLLYLLLRHSQSKQASQSGKQKRQDKHQLQMSTLGIVSQSAAQLRWIQWPISGIWSSASHRLNG